MPSISIKLIVVVHWILVTWATHWSVQPFIWGNITALAIGIWAIADKQSVDAVLMFMTTLSFTIIVDIVMLALFFPLPLGISSGSVGVLRFSEAMAIINLILKPFSILLLYQMYKDRGGEYNINFGPNNTTYDNIGTDEGANPEHGSSAYVNSPVVSKN